jgi:hypothetical protein
MSQRLLDRIFSSNGGEQRLSNLDVDVLTPDDWRWEVGIIWIQSSFQRVNSGHGRHARSHGVERFLEHLDW